MKVYEGPQRTTIELEITKDLDWMLDAIREYKRLNALPQEQELFYEELVRACTEANNRKNLNLLFM